MTTGNIVVVIPVYKENISKNEIISLTQGENILGQYDICFIAPTRMKNGKLVQRHRTIYFDDLYFENTVAYSRLLLSDFFYKTFLNYDYMLIYQLDAFVFSDMLLKWCDKKYDYIGAPLPAVGDFYAEIGSGVGNGGLSLRKIESCIRVLKYADKILKNHPIGWMMQQAEDLYFSYCGADSSIDFRVPDSKEAIKFSTQDNLYNIFSEHDRCLPFGTHAWDRLNYSHWKPYVESFGYKTEPPNREITSACSARTYAVRMFISKYVEGLWYPDFADKLKDWLKSSFGTYAVIAVRGSGKVGQRVADTLGKAGIDYLQVDKNADGVRTIVPNDDFYKNKYPIFVASTKYEEEIKKELENYDYTDDDYVTYKGLEAFICKEYPDITKRLMNKYLHIDS